MRHSLRVLSLIVAIAVGMVALTQAGSVTQAQEATAPAGQTAMAGLTYTSLGVLPNLAVPSPTDVEVARGVFAPGAGFGLDASDPVGALLILESGSLTVTVEDQTWSISRGAALAQAMATPGTEPEMAAVVDEIAMGEAGTLHAGDVAYVPGGVNGQVANTGTEPASVLVVQMAPSEMMGAATPTP